VGIDGSLPAHLAANVAIQIASKMNLSIRGLYVVDDGVVMKRYSDIKAENDGRGSLSNRRDYINQLKAKGEVCLTWLEKQCQIENVSMAGDLVYGSVPDVFYQEASDAIMLALGKRGEGHIKETHTLGSNFRAIIEKQRKPILIGGEKERPLRKILFIEKSGRDISQTLDLVASLQKSIHGGLIGLDIQKNNIAMQVGLSEIMTEFRKIGITDYRLIGRAGWSVEDIEAAACEYSADLIVMRKDRSPVMIKWLTGATLGRLILAMQLPILLIHEYGLIYKIDLEQENDKYVVHS
jgi:nucleotide-binding universal stress UspA family protein